MEAVDRAFGTEEIAPLSTERRYPSENAELAKAHTEIFMEIAKPMFAIGLKDLTEFTDPKDRLRHALRFNLLLRLLFSRSSPFYNDLYNRSLVSDALEPLYEFTSSCAYMLIMGESEKPEDVFDEIKKLFSDIPEEMLKEENFLRVKRAMYADNIRLLDSTESIAYEITDAAIHGYTLWDVGTEIQKITLEEIKQLSIEYFKDKPLAFAVIRPISEQ
jgi:predicted Zn-dependent peptidase